MTQDLSTIDVLLFKCLLADTTVAEIGATFALHDKRKVDNSDLAQLDAAVAPVAENVRAIVSGARGAVPASLMEKLPKLEIVVSRTAGIDYIDLEYAKKRGIVVTNTSLAQADDVADTAIALLLTCSRRTLEGDAFVRAGKWAAGETPPSSRSLRDKSIGIVGLGFIGKAIARRAAAMRMKVAYTKRRKLDGEPYDYVPSVLELAKRSDYLVVAAAGGAETRNLVNAEVLAALGPAGYLINIARASIVNREDLLAALQAGTIAGAGIDVFWEEPKVPEDLFALPNVVLSPHSASRTLETHSMVDRLVVDNLIDHFSGKPVVSALD